MDSNRFDAIVQRYSKLRVAVLGDFCLDRYLEIDPAKSEMSIETGLPVHNVIRVRAQPGGAGTVLNNLVALGVGQIFPVAFCGDDGEGYELQQALRKIHAVSFEYFFATSSRRTFTYTKPLVLQSNQSPRELNRLDLKNWSPTPIALRKRIAQATKTIAVKVDAIIVLDQTDIPNTGVIGREVLQALLTIRKEKEKVFILADSRRGLRGFPPLAYKMNRAELASLCGSKTKLKIPQIKTLAAALAKKNQRPVFITLAEEGIVGGGVDGQAEHAPALKIRGDIDIVGAGDSVTANLTTALSSGASLREALEIANAAASVVIHKLGTTGTASVKEIRHLLRQQRLMRS